MKVRLLDLAGADLVDAYRFYELQSVGVGAYFFNTLTAEIKTLRQYAGILSVYLVTIGCSRAVFPTPFTIRWRAMK